MEIVVYKRAIPPFTPDSEAVKRIHQVCCRLDDLAGSRRPGIALHTLELAGSSVRQGGCGVFRERA